MVEGGEGADELAARLLGATAALLDAAGAPTLLQADRPHHERVLAATRAALDEGVFERAWSAGRTMTLDAAAMLALAQGAPGSTFV